MKITAGILTSNRQSFHLSSGLRLGNDNAINAPQINLAANIGSTPMLKFAYSRFCTVEGIVFQTQGNGTRMLSFDGVNGGFIGTTGRVRGCYFFDQTNANVDLTAIAISETEPTNNHEFYEIVDNFAILGARQFVCGLATRTGANTWSLAASYRSLADRGDGNPVAVGQRVRIALQNQIYSSPICLDTTIASVNTGANTFTTVADATPNPNEAVQCIIGGAGDAQYPFTGTFLLVGANSNSKQHLVKNNQINTAAYGIHMKGGSAHIALNKFEFCEKAIYTENAVEGIDIHQNDSETCACFADINGQVPFTLAYNRLAPQFADPVNGYVHLGATPRNVRIMANTWTQPMPPHCRFLNLDLAGAVTTSVEGNCFDTGTNPDSFAVGIDAAQYQFPRPVTLLGNSAITNITTGFHVISGGIRQVGSGQTNQMDSALAVGPNSTALSWWTGIDTTWVPGTIAAGVTVTRDIATNGSAQFFDSNMAVAGVNVDLQGCNLWAQQIGFHSVRVYIRNPTGAGITINGGAAIQTKVALFHF
ncbi:MAG TPA: hypothetical protein VGJ18_00075 [Gemmatimonadaceae bacterium]|jgi:hypothetical protein